MPACQVDESVREMKRGPGIGRPSRAAVLTKARLAHRFSTASATPARPARAIRLRGQLSEIAGAVDARFAFHAGPD